MPLLSTSRPGNLRLQAQDGETIDVTPVAGGGAGGNTLVYRPGGIAGANVYTDWPSLNAAANSLAGPKTIQVDASLVGNNAHVPAGVWNVNLWKLQGSNAISTTTLIFDQGAVLQFTQLTFSSELTCTSNSNAPVMDSGSTPGAAPVLFIELTSTLTSSGNAPVIRVRNGGSFFVFLSTVSQIGDGVHNVIQADVGSTTFVTETGQSQVFAHAITSTAPAQPQVVMSDDCTLNLPQDGNGVLQVLTSFASQVSYGPVQPSNWNPSPTTVQKGLDQLVQPNTQTNINAAGLGPATSVSITAPNITRALSGVFLVTATMSGTDAAADTVSMVLQRDGLTIAGFSVKIPTVGAGNNWELSATLIHIVGDANPHSFAAVATGASNLSVPASQAYVAVTEFP